MRRILLGFIAGTALTSLAFVLRDPPRQTEAASTSGLADPPSTGVAADRTRDRIADADRPGETEAAAADTPENSQDPPALREDDATPEARLRRELADTQQALDDTRAQLQALLVDRELADAPIISPISLPAEFDWIWDNAYRGLFHDRMQREAVDAAWAGPMEAELLSFVYEQPGIVNRYGPPTIRCHSTQCEVTFLSAGSIDPTTAAQDARGLFDESFESLPGVFDCGPGECWVDANIDDGVTTIFWGMTKDEAKLEDTLREQTAAANLR